MVLLYCRQYFRMHFASSYAMFDKCFPDPEELDGALFIDFGCGPGTSGLAFAEWRRDDHFSYIGIDRSAAMCNMADALFAVGGLQERSYFDNDPGLDILSNIDRKDTHLLNSPIVVLNLCFVLASSTFRANKIAALAKEKYYFLDKLLLGKFKCSVVYLVYQNPEGDYFHENWRSLTDRLIKVIKLASRKTRSQTSNNEITKYLQIEPMEGFPTSITYDLPNRSKKTVHCDILFIHRNG